MASSDSLRFPRARVREVGQNIVDRFVNGSQRHFDMFGDVPPRRRIPADQFSGRTPQDSHRLGQTDRVKGLLRSVQLVLGVLAQMAGERVISGGGPELAGSEQRPLGARESRSPTLCARSQVEQNRTRGGLVAIPALSCLFLCQGIPMPWEAPVS